MLKKDLQVPTKQRKCLLHPHSYCEKKGKNVMIICTKHKCELFAERLFIELFSLSLKLELPKLTLWTYPEMRANKGGGGCVLALLAGVEENTAGK